ncbi:MAG TPA: stage II sporulation protein M [Gemmatimonadales bacterium]|nr:stage II sporulation protein M [Gemmatimonadales bacterium]
MPSPRPAPPLADFRQHLEIETPEHVVLDLEIAGIGSRMLAALIDTAILGGVLLAGNLLLVILAAYDLLPTGPWLAAVAVGATFVIWTGYFVFFEGLRGGRTPGKRRMGLRVVRDTGHPATVTDAVTRNLLRLADFLPPPYLGGLLLAALHPRGKRLGDLAAGTVVVRDRPVESAPAPPSAEPAGATLMAPALDDEEFGLLARFVGRASQLEPAVRDRVGTRLAERLAAHLPPHAAAESALHALYARERERRRGPIAGRGGASDRFAARQAPRWAEFHALAERAVREGLDSFRPDELPEFAARYREVAADLARARTYQAAPDAVARLERLVAAGHNALYRDERSTWRSVWVAVSREFPAAVLQAYRAVLLAFALFAATSAVGYRMIRDRPALAEELLPEEMLRHAAEGAARTGEGRKYGEVAWAERPLAASFIITNNVRVAITCFAGGIFLGIGSLVVLAFNGVALGTFAGHFANQGLLAYLLEFVVGHGVLELSAIWIATAAGLLLGMGVVAPGELSRSDALVLNGRVAARMMGMVVVLLGIAGLIEGFLSTAGGGIGARAAAAAGSLAFLAAYLLNGARRRT